GGATFALVAGPGLDYSYPYVSQLVAPEGGNGLVYGLYLHGLRGEQRAFYRSTDGGRTRSQPAGAPAVLARLAVDPRNPRMVWAFSGSILYRSADAGSTWEVRGTLPSAFIRDGGTIAVSPIDSTTLFVGGAPGVVESRDGGVTWTDISGGLPT